LAVLLIIVVIVIVVLVTIATWGAATPLLTLVIMGAIVGAVTSAMISVATSLWTNRSLSGWEILKAAGIGALTGAAGGLLGGLAGPAAKALSMGSKVVAKALEVAAPYVVAAVIDVGSQFVSGGFSFKHFSFEQLAITLAVTLVTMKIGAKFGPKYGPQLAGKLPSGLSAKLGLKVAPAGGVPIEPPTAGVPPSETLTPAARPTEPPVAAPKGAEPPTTTARPGETTTPAAGPKEPPPAPAGRAGEPPAPSVPETPTVEAGAAPKTPEEVATLETTANKKSEDLTPAEATTEREVAGRGKGEPVDDPPFTTKHELPNGHEVSETPDGEMFKRCSNGCIIFDKDGNPIASAEETPTTTPTEKEGQPSTTTEKEAPPAAPEDELPVPQDETPSTAPKDEPTTAPKPKEDPTLPRRPTAQQGKPTRPPRPKPSVTEPNAAEWRYQEYVAKQTAKGKPVKGPDQWYEENFLPSFRGDRPGRLGGAQQVKAKQQLLANENVQPVENVKLGNRFPDGVKPNANGGTDYFEVGTMNKNGLPESRELTKIGDEIPALGPDDTVTFVDKNNINRRITYRPGDSTTKRAPPIK
jgi:hypothetical protein